MGLTVCLAASNSLYYPQGGGHQWVSLNWALGLQSHGCKVIWLEGVVASTPASEVQARIATLKSRLEPYGLMANLALFSWTGEPLSPAAVEGCLDLEAASEAHLLLNLQYDMRAEQVGRFRRSALVDIDPGLLQIWMTTGRVSPARHDVYFTIGETVGRSARFPACGLQWHYTPPPVFLPAWPLMEAGPGAPYTTVAHLWGEPIEFEGTILSTEKRSTLLEYLDLPARTEARLELALCLTSDSDPERQLWEQHGWQVQHAWRVTSTAEEYREYIQRSRGEFSCAKPSCMQLENAWISDRTICYLASGKPAIVQHTGTSRFLPDAEGLFRFRTVDEAVAALTAVEDDYARHSRKARALAEEFFDAHKVVGRVLEVAL